MEALISIHQNVLVATGYRLTLKKNDSSDLYFAAVGWNCGNASFSVLSMLVSGILKTWHLQIFRFYICFKIN